MVTLHRPALVDGPLLADALGELADIAGELDVVFPAHPRTRARIEREGIDPGRVRLLEPLGYLAFLEPGRGRRRACSPTRAGSRRRRPTSACPASRCATTRSAR